MRFKSFISEVQLYTCNNLIPHVPSHTIRLWFYKKIMEFKIEKGSHIFMGCRFDCTRNLIMGKNSVINPNCRFDVRGGIKIGDNVSISNDVIILTADHDIDSIDMLGRERAVVLEDYVWIGTRAMIMPGVTVSKGAVVAAGAVVTKSVKAFDVVAGVPAKVIKQRFFRTNFNYDASYKRLFQ